MIEEVFKKGKKQREIAKKFDEKLAQKTGSINKRKKFEEFKQNVSMRNSEIHKCNIISHKFHPNQMT